MMELGLVKLDGSTDLWNATDKGRRYYKALSEAFAIRGKMRSGAGSV
jgi:hypothetical protein